MALSISIRADATQFTRTIAGVRVQMSGLSGGIANVTASAVSFGAALAKAGLAVGVLGAAITAAFIKSSSGAAASMESMLLQFDVLTGSSSKAKDLMKTFREEAMKSPLSVTDYATAARGFMSYGVAAEDVLPTLKMLGDVSMGNAERFGLLSYAMAQVASNATLKGDDLRQLVAQGFNPLAIIAKKTGRNITDLTKDMEDHKITYEMVTAAMKDVTSAGGRFFGAIERGAETTEGKLAKFQDTILSLKIALGTGFNEGLVELLDAGGGGLSGLESGMTRAGKALGLAIKNAVSGDYGMFVQIGVVIGEAMIAGIKATVNVGLSSLLRDGIGNYISAGGRVVGSEGIVKYGQVVNAVNNARFGPGLSMQDSVKEQFGGGFKRELETLNNMVGLQGAAKLPPNYHETLKEEAIKQSGYLQLLAKDPFNDFMGPLFSR